MTDCYVVTRVTPIDFSEEVREEVFAVATTFDRARRAVLEDFPSERSTHVRTVLAEDPGNARGAGHYGTYTEQLAPGAEAGRYMNRWVQYRIETHPMLAGD